MIYICLIGAMFNPLCWIPFILLTLAGDKKPKKNKNIIENREISNIKIEIEIKSTKK